MPRKSADARAAEHWRVGIGHPKPRRGMSAPARRIWREVVEARPADFFTTGSLNMLRTFCDVSVLLEQVGADVLATPDDDKLIERFRKLGTMQANLGQKLRLSIQSALTIEGARVKERAEPEKPQSPALLGGKSSWRQAKVA